MKNCLCLNPVSYTHLDVYKRQPQDNHQLVVMFKNHQDDNKQYQLQEEKFENLFGGWEIGLTAVSYTHLATAL